MQRALSSGAPHDALLAEIARAITGKPACVASVWNELKERCPALGLRADVEDWDAFRTHALRQAKEAGLLRGFLLRLLTDGLVNDMPFRLAATRLLGEGCLELETARAEAEGEGDLLFSERRTRFMPELEPGFDQRSGDRYYNQDAGGALQHMAQAVRQVCRIEIGGEHRGTGVLVKPLLVATAAHVVAELVDAERPIPVDFARHRELALPGGAARLALFFGDLLDYGRTSGRGETGERVGEPAAVADDWLAFYSPPAAAERQRPFDVFCGTGIARRKGPWDLALIRLAETPRSLGVLAPLESEAPPSRRFKVTMLHHPRHPVTGALPLQTSEGEAVGFLRQRVRMLHDVRTAEGSSGAPCFNRGFNVVALHQGGAWRGEERFGRAIPVEPWATRVDRIRGDDPITYLATVPAVDGGPPQPVIGRRALQRRIWAGSRSDASAASRLFVIRGGSGQGKSFSARLVAAMRGKGHVVVVLDLSNCHELDDAGLVGRVAAALGEQAGLGSPGRDGPRERLVRDGSLPDLLALLGEAARERPLWFTFDGFKSAALVEGTGVAQLIDGLIGALDDLPGLRLMLTGWTRPLPERLAGCVEELELPNAAEIVDHALLRYAPPGATIDPDARAQFERTIARTIQPCLDRMRAPPATPRPVRATHTDVQMPPEPAVALGRRLFANLLESVAPLLSKLETAVFAPDVSDEAGTVPFAEEVRRAWAQRSPAELAARRSLLAEQRRQSSPEEQKAIALIRRRGALSGPVDPLRLLDGIKDVDGPERLLDSVAQSFDRTRSGDEGWRWTMRSGARAPALTELLDGKLTGALADPGLPPTDAAGERLRLLLRDPATAKEMLGSSPAKLAEAAADHHELQALLQALTWLRAAIESPLHPLQDIVRVSARREAALKGRTESYQRLLEAGLFGRERSLARLKAFAAEPVSNDRIPVIAVTGAKGAGKSSLLAAFAKTVLTGEHGDGPLLVHLDFDRIALRRGGELEWTLEVSRQIGLVMPVLCTKLDRLRDEIRSIGGPEAEFDEDVRLSLSSLFQERAAAIARGSGLATRPIVLLLDTFEEWRRSACGDEDRPGRSRANDRERRAVEWLAALRWRMGLEGLRVVISGRAPPDAGGRAMDARAPIRLGPLSRAAALRLLRHLGLDDAEAERALHLIGHEPDWSPEDVRVAGQALSALPTARRRAVLAGAGESGRLYVRLIQQVPDDVRAMARVTMVLREVTTPVIGELLGSPVGLGILTETSAEGWLEKLALETWLFARRGNGLEPRPEVRRRLLRSLASDGEGRALLRRMHASAAQWYAGNRSDLHPALARREARYHELAAMPDDGDLPEIASPSGPASAREELRALLPDRTEFPARAGAQLRFLLDGWVPDELPLLPEHARAAALDGRAREWLRLGEPARAVELATRPTDLEPAWMAEARLKSGSWGCRPTFTRRFSARLGPDHRAALRFDLSDHVVAAFLAGKREREELSCLIDRLRRGMADLRRRAPEPGEAIYPDALFAVAVAGERQALPREVVREFIRLYCRFFPPARSPAAALRRVLAAAAWGVPDPDQIQLAGNAWRALLRLDPDWLDRLGGHVGAETKAKLAKIAADLRGGWTSADLLGRVELAARDGPAPQELILLVQRLARDAADGERAAMLRGVDARFHLAASAALEKAWGDDFRRAGEVAAALLKFVPADMTGDALVRSGAREPRATWRHLVHIVDQAGELPRLLSGLAKEKPRAATLKRVTEGLAKWDESATDFVKFLPPPVGKARRGRTAVMASG